MKHTYRIAAYDTYGITTSAWTETSFRAARASALRHVRNGYIGGGVVVRRLDPNASNVTYDTVRHYRLELRPGRTSAVISLTM